MTKLVPLATFKSFSMLSKYEGDKDFYTIAIDEQIRNTLLDNGQTVTYWFFNEADRLYHYCKLINVEPHPKFGYKFQFRLLSNSYVAPKTS